MAGRYIHEGRIEGERYVEGAGGRDVCRHTFGPETQGFEVTR